MDEKTLITDDLRGKAKGFKGQRNETLDYGWGDQQKGWSSEFTFSITIAFHAILSRTKTRLLRLGELNDRRFAMKAIFMLDA